MKKIFLSTMLISVTMSAMAQLSPYVEAFGVVNNTKFKATMQRAAPLARPVPVHLQDEPINTTLAPRFVVAKADHLTTMTWAVASGWTIASNTTTGSTVASPATGCNIYFEAGLGAGVGTWRLPTQRELMIIYLCRKEFTVSNVGFVNFAASTYWASTSNSATDAWAMDFTNGTMFNRPKTTNFRVRCVRDL